MEPTQGNQTLKFFLLAATGILIVAGVYVYSVSRQTATTQKAATTEQVETVPTVVETSTMEGKQMQTGDGSMLLQVKDNQTVVVGDSVTVSVLASTVDPIVGFDVVLNFDPQRLSYLGVQNQIEAFLLVPTSERGQVIVTGTKKLLIKEAQTVNNVSLVQVTFKAVSAGQAPFSLAFTKGATNDSNLINTQSKDVLGKVAGATVTIK